MGHNGIPGHTWVPTYPGATGGPCERCRYGPDALVHTGGVCTPRAVKEATAAHLAAITAAREETDAARTDTAQAREDLHALTERHQFALLALTQVRTELRRLALLHHINNHDLARGIGTGLQAVDIIESVLTGTNVLPLPEVVVPPGRQTA